MQTVTHEPQKPNEKASERTCAGCRATDAKSALVRFAVSDDAPYLVADLGAKLGGRGVSVHARLACLRAAVKGGGFARSLRRAVPVTVDELVTALVASFGRRMEGLVIAARRKRALAYGTDAVREELHAGRAALLVVAEDAAGRRDDVVALADAGRVPRITWGTKESLGRMLGRDVVGLIAILDAGIAAGLAESAGALLALSEAE